MDSVSGRAYLRDHEDHLALQRLRRNHQLTPDDLTALEEMLIGSGAGTQADIARAKEEAHGLGLFVPVTGRAGPRGCHRSVRPAT